VITLPWPGARLRVLSQPATAARPLRVLLRKQRTLMTIERGYLSPRYVRRSRCKTGLLQFWESATVSFGGCSERSLHRILMSSSGRKLRRWSSIRDVSEAGKPRSDERVRKRPPREGELLAKSPLCVKRRPGRSSELWSSIQRQV